jgi:site-specific recombinase XerD
MGLDVKVAELISSEVKAHFAHWLGERGLSQTTIYNHMTGLHNFARWYLLKIGKMLAPEDVTVEDVIAYRDYLWGGRQPRQPRRILSGGTIWKYYSSAKKFAEWAKTNQVD